MTLHTLDTVGSFTCKRAIRGMLYTERQLFKLYTSSNRAHPKNSKQVGPGIEPALSSSEAINQLVYPTTLLYSVVWFPMRNIKCISLASKFPAVYIKRGSMKACRNIRGNTVMQCYHFVRHHHDIAWGKLSRYVSR